MRKYPVLYEKSHKGYMEIGANCLSAKKNQEPKIVFSIYVVLSQFFVVFFFKNITLKGYFILFDLFIVIHHFLKRNKYHEQQII